MHISICRDRAYLTRIQLAVLDHNAHLQRKGATNSKGEQIYQRKYRKQSKKWDVTPLKEDKQYSYIDEMMLAVFEEQKKTCIPLKRSLPLPDEHPQNIQGTIAHTQPNNTSDIVKNKKSRYCHNN